MAASAPSGRVLLLGVHSWPDALRRRHVIRQLCPSTNEVDVRFIMADAILHSRGRKGVQHEAPGEDLDILRYVMADTKAPRVLQKLFIANAFLRHAATLDYHFVGRTEDDALMNVTALGQHLQMLTTVPLLVYTAKGMFVMWDRESLLPRCWNAAVQAWGGKVDCRASQAGPFLLFQGPLVVYSRLLTRLLVALPRFSDDEARVARNFSSVRKQRIAAEQIYNPGALPRLGIVYSGVAEDVYYSSLLADESTIATRNVTVVSVPLSEYDWRRPRPTHTLRAAAVYHRLLTLHHLNVSGVVQPLLPAALPPPPPPVRRSRHSAAMAAEQLKLVVSATPLLGQWWRRSQPPLSRCKSFVDKFRAYKPPHSRSKAPLVRPNFCCRHWLVCEP